jgi:hypothetical protein
VGLAVVSGVVVAAVVGGSVVGASVVGGAVVGGSVVGGSVVGGAVVGGSVVGGSVVGGAVVGDSVVGGPVVGGPVVGGFVPVGGLVVGGLVPGGAGTPAMALGPDGGVVSSGVMGLMDWISPPTPVITGKPSPVGVGGWEEAADDPGGWPPPPPPPPGSAPGGEVSGVGLSVAPAMAPPKLVHPGVQGPWSLSPNTSSSPTRAATVAAQARARRRSEGRQLTR